MNEQSETNSEQKKHKKERRIIVNSRETLWEEREITFEQVVILAFGSYSNNNTTAYTVTYKRGHGNKPEGSMVYNDSIKVKEGMIFNVAQTDKS